MIQQSHYWISAQRKIRHYKKKILGSVYVVNYIYRLVYVEPALHPRDKSYLIMMDKFLICCCNQLANILLKIFASMFIMDKKEHFYTVGSLLGFGIRMMLTS